MTEKKVNEQLGLRHIWTGMLRETHLDGHALVLSSVLSFQAGSLGVQTFL